MTHLLKNKQLEIQLDLPEEGYNLARFDHTGKIVKVKFRNIDISGVERTDWPVGQQGGKGFYNEFGIDNALGYDEADQGGWFHKIGVGLLKKDDQQYLFSKNYEVKPAAFEYNFETNKVILTCNSQSVNGYSYLYKKEIELFESRFRIKYYLENTGEKVIATDEYNHNFIAINNDLIGSNYVLKFPFHLKPELFEETVNPEGKVELSQKEIGFSDTPQEPFFFSNLTGGESTAAKWELINLKTEPLCTESA